MVSSHFELRFQLNFNQVTMDWQRRSFLRNNSPIISLDASNVEKEMDAELGYLLGWSSDSNSEFDPDEYDWELEVEYMYSSEIIEDWYEQDQGSQVWHGIYAQVRGTT